MDFNLNEGQLQRLDVKCRYLLTQIKNESKTIWKKYFDSYDYAELEELPNWYEKAKNAYKEILKAKEEV